MANVCRAHEWWTVSAVHPGAVECKDAWPLQGEGILTPLLLGAITEVQGSRFKVLLFIIYSIIQDIISSEIRTGPLNGQCKKKET